MYIVNTKMFLKTSLLAENLLWIPLTTNVMESAFSQVKNRIRVIIIVQVAPEFLWILAG